MKNVANVAIEPTMNERVENVTNKIKIRHTHDRSKCSAKVIQWHNNIIDYAKRRIKNAIEIHVERKRESMRDRYGMIW